MKALIQRVDFSKCFVDDKLVSSIDFGILVFLGIKTTDTEQDVDYIVNKIKNLRIFQDQDGKTNKSIKDIDCQIMIISQFTLYADTTKGNRPSFINAASKEIAYPLYLDTISKLRKDFIVKEGVFGANMKINFQNSGPFTIMIKSERE